MELDFTNFSPKPDIEIGWNEKEEKGVFNAKKNNDVGFK